MNDRLEKLVERLRERGYRLTPQRLAVIKILLDNPSHPTAEQVYAEVKSDYPMTSLATVYKTVAMLKDLNEILEIHLGDSGSRYDGVNPLPHAHIICVQCKQILDTDVVDLSLLANSLGVQTGYQMINQRLDFFGICPACQYLTPHI